MEAFRLPSPQGRQSLERLWLVVGPCFHPGERGPPGPERRGRILECHRAERVGKAELASLCLQSRFAEHTPPCPLTVALLFQTRLCLATDMPSWSLKANTPKCHRYFKSRD